MADLTTKPQLIGDVLALVPASASDREKLAKAKLGKPYRTTISQPRSRKHENWYRGLCRVVAEGVDWHPDKLYSLLKIEAGKIERVHDSPTYGMVVELKSATKMDDEEYRRLTDFALEFIFRDILPSVRRSDVIEQVEAMCGPRPI